ncbi:MAG: histidine kinase [Verrucomicrobiales bacterium]|nr:histidine kinase [Verrucomicrobiales bacterium]
MIDSSAAHCWAMTTGGPHPAEVGPRRGAWYWLRGGAITLLIAAVFGLIQASQWVLASANFGRTFPWTVAVVNGLTETVLWTPLVVPIFWLARRFPLSGSRWPVSLSVHLVGAVTAASLYSTFHAAVNEWVIPDSMQIMRFIRGPRPPPPEPPRDPALPSTHPSAAPSTPSPTPSPSSSDSRPQEAVGHGSNPGRGRSWDRGMTEPTLLEKARTVLTTRWFLHLLTYGIIVGIFEWTGQQRRLRAGERQAQELSRQLAEARLQALRMQLNPHFLFNTLNAIATLVYRSPHVADEMISSLSDFLRLTLTAPNTPQVPLKKEMEFARHYLDIEKVRFGDRLSIVETIEPESLTVSVPTLILQPLLENAIRHGIEPKEQRGEIRLSSRREGNTLVLSVTDTGQGLASSGQASSGGIGLANTRSRLSELHGAAASLNLIDRPGAGLEVEVRLPWKSLATA